MAGPRKEVVLPGVLTFPQELESERRLLVGGGTAEGTVPPRQKRRRNTWPFLHLPIFHQYLLLAKPNWNPVARKLGKCNF